MDVAEIMAAARREGRNVVSEAQAKAVLQSAGVPVPRGVVVSSAAELEEATASLSFPLALKVISPLLVHKSDAGGVKLSLGSLEQVRTAMRETGALPGRTAWLVEEMVTGGLEVMIGGVRHPRFGPMLMVGLGGIFVEYLNDVSLRICPVTLTEAGSMLASLRSAALLDGVRGQAGVDRAALIETLLCIGGEDGLLMTHGGDIAELDINPLIARPDGVCAVDVRIIVAPSEPERTPRPVADIRALLQPRAVAVAGASSAGTAQANQYIRNLRAYGFEGRLYAIHPSAKEVDGLPAYPRFADLPEAVDYAYIAVAAERCPPLLAEASGKVAFAQVMSGGFGEGASDTQLEAALVAAAYQGGARVLGPNCMGTHSPLGKLTYMSGVDSELGSISIIAQSGGLSTDILRRGGQRGLRFRALVTVGNCADLGPAELAGAFLDDPHTRVLGMYIEDARRGRPLFETLRQRMGSKPVVALIGGMSEQGIRAAQSHTGALAGDARAWAALAAQTGMVLTETLDQFLGVLLAMQQLEPRTQRPTQEIVLFGNGGGTSVLAADEFARAGLSVSALPSDTLGALETLALPVGTSIINPIDVPANVLAREDGAIALRIVARVFENARPDAFVIHMNVPVILGYGHVDILGNLMRATLEHCRAGRTDAHVVLVLRSDGEPEIEALKAGMRARALEAGIPVYDELSDAAAALQGLATYERALTLVGQQGL